MIFLENDFLKTYNELDSTWNITSENTVYKFDEVINKLVNFDAKSITDEGIRYWSGLRAVCWDKKGRRNQTENKSWCSRFLTFYLVYEAEELIIKNSKKYLNLVLTRPERSTATILTYDAIEQAVQQESVIDFKTTLANGEPTYVEAKTLGALTTVHGAKYVIRHTPLKDYIRAGKKQVFTFFLTGHKDDLDLLYGSGDLYSENKNVIVLDDSISLDRGPSRLPSTINKNESILVSLPSEALLNRLYFIDNFLDSIDNGEAKAIHLLDNQTRLISNTLDKNFTAFKTDDPLPSNSVKSAKTNLISAATQLASAVENESEENHN